MLDNHTRRNKLIIEKEVKGLSPEVGDICIFSNEDTLKFTDATVKDCMVCTGIRNIGEIQYQANFHTYYKHCMVIKKNKLRLECTPLSHFDYDEIIMWLKSRIAYFTTFVYPDVLRHEDIPNKNNISEYATWVTSHIDNVNIKDTPVCNLWEMLHDTIFTDLYLDWLLPRLKYRYSYLVSRLECISIIYNESDILDSDNINYYSEQTVPLICELERVTNDMKHLNFDSVSAAKIYEE